MADLNIDRKSGAHIKLLKRVSTKRLQNSHSHTIRRNFSVIRVRTHRPRENYTTCFSVNRIFLLLRVCPGERKHKMKIASSLSPTCGDRDMSQDGGHYHHHDERYDPPGQRPASYGGPPGQRHEAPAPPLHRSSFAGVPTTGRAPPRRVNHTYCDYSNYPTEDLPAALHSPTNFPSKLHKILSDPDTQHVSQSRGT
jgi:hypothetical protein